MAIWNVLAIFVGEITLNQYEDYTCTFDGQKEGLLF